MRRTFLLLLALLAGVVSFGQWQWLNPLPAGRSINRIRFASGGQAFSINDFGDVYRCAQAGGPWTLQRHFPGAFTLDFRGNTGVVAGWGDAVYTTRDGGLTWTTSFLNSPEGSYGSYMSHVQVLTGDTIIAVDNNYTTLHRSNDGGRTWSDTVRHSNFNMLNELFFLDSRTVFRAGFDGVSRSNDAGRTWELVSTGAFNTKRIIHFFDRQRGVRYENHNILRTTDGGTNWSTTPIPFEIRSFSYDGPDTVYAGGEQQRVYRSLDGGATWADISAPNSFFGGDFSSTAFSHGVGYAGGSGGRLLYSDNAGAQWRPYGTFYNNVNGLQFTSADRAYLLTDTAVFRSDDRGVSWRAMPFTGIPSPGTFPQGLSHAWFRSNDTGVVFSRSQVQQYKTSDGGTTWTRMISGLSGYDAITDMDIVDNRTAFAIIGGSWFGRVLRSTDGGDTWLQVGQATGGKRIDFVDGRTGFALADNILMRSSDSGRTWQQIYTDPGGSFTNGLYFRNANTGYFFGDNSLLKKTTDGGITWTAQPVPSGHVDDIFFFNDQYGFLHTENNGMFRSFDGGTTWHPDPEVSYRPPGYAFTPDSLLYMGGYGGGVMRGPVKGILQDSLVVTDLTSCSARVSSWVSAAFGSVDQISFEYGTSGFTQTITPSIASVSNGSVRPSAELTNLEQGVQYRVRVKMVSGGTVRYSPHITLRPYTMLRPFIFVRNDTLFSSYTTGNQWFRDGVLIPGATGRFLVPELHGHYTVQVTENGCLSVLSAEQEARVNGSGERLQLYPNPARDWVNVSLAQATPQSYEIRSMGGVSLRSGVLRPGDNRIPLAGMAPGMYLLLVANSEGGSPTVRKIVCR